MIPPRPALPRPTNRLGIGDEMPRQAPRSPPRQVSYLGGWSGIGNAADYLRWRWKRVHSHEPSGLWTSPQPSNPPAKLWASWARVVLGGRAASPGAPPRLFSSWANLGPSWGILGALGFRWAMSRPCALFSISQAEAPAIIHTKRYIS
ncbi:conserved hypothetical protein [Histoplasma capsulatum H143]|uniref:Uncharacterized protein n=1 Tax=Ajellomyces capsulatus (strain H143) TaxID=544712 RepID=C6HK81_AJECH|nr:conserved hypothetical protein [Histoplasma capsulatum H143]